MTKVHNKASATETILSGGRLYIYRGIATIFGADRVTRTVRIATAKALVRELNLTAMVSGTSGQMYKAGGAA